MPCTRGRTGGARRLSSRPLWECPGDARLVPPAGKPAFESPEPLSGPRPSAGKFLEAHSTEALGGSLQLGRRHAARRPACWAAKAFLHSVTAVGVCIGVPPSPHCTNSRAQHPTTTQSPMTTPACVGAGASCGLILSRPPAPGGHVRRPRTCTEPRRHPPPRKAGPLRPCVLSSWRRWLLRGHAASFPVWGLTP